MEIWIPKYGKDPTPEIIESVWEAWCRDSPKDECKVQLEGLEKEWWSVKELGLLRSYQFPRHVTSSDGSVVADCMRSGFVCVEGSQGRGGRERIGREEEGTSSGRSEMETYTTILRHTPDHEDLVTVTDSEVLCRVVGRWVG